MDKFAFPKTLYNIIKPLKPTGREALYSAIFGYMFEGIEPELRAVELKVAWPLIVKNLSKIRKISASKSEQCQDNVQTMSEDCPKNVATMSKECSNNVGTMSQQSNENVETMFEECRDKEKEKKSSPLQSPLKEKNKEKPLDTVPQKKFVKPTIDQVREYINEKGYHINPNDFIDHYEANGWKVGKVPMKDWRASIRYWASRDKQENPAKYVEVKSKEAPYVSECPICHSTELIHDYRRYGCPKCNLMWDWNAEDGCWEVTL